MALLAIAGGLIHRKKRLDAFKTRFIAKRDLG